MSPYVTEKGHRHINSQWFILDAMAKSADGTGLVKGNSGLDEHQDDVLYETSKSICPRCKQVIPCEIVFRDDKVFMKKSCENHGDFEVMIYGNAQDYIDSAKYNKLGAEPLHFQAEVSKGCPEDCGICPDHKQHTCVGVIEIPDSSNLNCPVCFADSEGQFIVPYEKVKEMIDLYVKCEGDPEVLQISGGEPTLHPDIIEILEYAGKRGINYPMLNTNGIKLADREFAKRISETMRDNSPVGKPLIYLQFDGMSDETYQILRGRPLLDIKLRALENCREFGMNVTLVPTIVKGVNEHEMGAIIDLALKDNNIKMVNFQPSTTTGRYDICEVEGKRITIPEVLKEIEEQTKGKLAKKGFINIPCPYPTCSVCTYVYKKGDEVLTLTELFDVDSYMEYIVNHTIPDDRIVSEVNEALDSLLSMSAVMGSEKSESALCLSCGMAIPNIGELVDNITLISVHAFMDELDFDLKRAQKCCVTEILPDGKMIPFCVYNMLYRDELKSKIKNVCGGA
jgi:uncharacterized radical SAM superfamily Fe-S cluster-containing enzyme